MQHRSLFSVPVLAVLSFTGQGEQFVPAATAQSTTQHSESADEQAITRTDSDFALQAQKRGADAWADFASSEFTVAEGRGQEAVREHYKKMYARPGFKLSWKPDYSKVFGDLGVTSGRYVMSMKGRPSGTGRYLTVWARQSDGSWKINWDSGTPDQAPSIQ